VDEGVVLAPDINLPSHIKTQELLLMLCIRHPKEKNFFNEILLKYALAIELKTFYLKL